MLFNGAAHAWHTGIAQLDCVLIEDLVKAVVNCEVFFYQLQELLSNIRSDTTVVWWVEPDDFSVTISAGCSAHIILQRRFMSTIG